MLEMERGETDVMKIMMRSSLLLMGMVGPSLLLAEEVAKMGFENPDGTPLAVDKDYFGNARNPENPSVSPFETPAAGRLVLKVWHKNEVERRND